MRGPEFIRKRAAVLLSRYGITPTKAEDRIETCVAMLRKYGCAPTFPTPGRVVHQYSSFIRHLQDVGAEIAVHSYDHVDLAACSPVEATEQLTRADQTFKRYGIEAYGFRCPYLRCTDALLDGLPQGLFGYSSNKAIGWEAIHFANTSDAGMVFDTIRRFYQPKSALEAVCVPWTRTNMIEIPVCVPDDLQLHDGLQLAPEGVAQAWGQILDETHRRGELFNLLFHPELAAYSEQLLGAVLVQARRLEPVVWIARLRDISEWWREKAGFKIEAGEVPTGLRLSFTCSPRATILARGLGSCETGQVWDGAYRLQQSRILDVPADPRPFVGLSPSAPEPVVSFLREQGYIVDTTDTAARCAIYFDSGTWDGLTQVQLIDHIEASPGPLVRYWRWPNGAKSAMCISGDLDALTLLDYASRLFVH
jgi:hypothetical protein